MELNVNEYQLPAEIKFNYDELKAELTEKIEVYKNLVYTDEQVKEAKADRATLNKFKSALNDARLSREKEYMKPFNEFEAKVNDLIKIIDEPIGIIDTQVKEFELKKKEEKREEINKYYAECQHPGWLELANIFDEKWLNASVSMKSIQEAIALRTSQVEQDIRTLSELPEFGFEATEVYKSTLDMNKAINEAQRMSNISKMKAEQEKAKAEAEAKKAEYEKTQAAKLAEQVAEPVEQVAEPVEQIKEQPKTWVNFSAYVTVEQARELKRFFDDRCIDFKAI